MVTVQCSRLECKFNSRHTEYIKADFDDVAPMREEGGECKRDFLDFSGCSFAEIEDRSKAREKQHGNPQNSE